ncbi:MAG: hypothetical protein KC621_33810, partial [Myxococcales bacterium]|nr:hypothetical protein [Myxococcales bacterium]
MPDSIALPQPTSPFPIRPRSLLSVLLIGLVSLPSWADEIRIDATCSLGDAIVAANTDSSVGGCVHDGLAGADTLLLDVDVVLTAADTARSSLLAGAHAGLPDVSSEITIQADAGGSRIERHPVLSCEVADGPDEFRLLQVTGSGSLTLRGLLLANGCANRGGAVLVADTATLTVENVTFAGNTARAPISEPVFKAEGGALRAAGTATVTISGALFEGNLATGERADGGALWEEGALVSLSDSRFVANRAEALQDFTNGEAASGGGAWVHAPAMSGLVFEDNLARGADATGNAGGGFGGALYVAGVGATLAGARFTGNVARGGTGGGRGGHAIGGAIYFNDSGGTVERVSLVSNLAAGGPGGTLRGGDGSAGGIYPYEIALLEHVTLSGNEARGGDSAASLGGDAEGGGLWIDSSFGPSVLRHATVVGNRAVAGAGTSGDGLAKGAGLLVTDELHVGASVLEGNTATEGSTTLASPCTDGTSPSSLTSLGFNTVAEASPDCAFDQPTDQTEVGPSLLTLGEYGCSTTLPDGSCLPTHPVAIGSPAHDAGSCSASGVSADARGYSRPWDDPDIANLDDGCDA